MPRNKSPMKSSKASSSENKATDPLLEFVYSLPSEHQSHVLAILGVEKMPINTKLVYLEDHLTVKQIETCRKLLEEQSSNFKQYLTPGQLNLVEKMILKKDFDSIEILVADTPAALAALNSFLILNGYKKKEDSEERNVVSGNTGNIVIEDDGKDKSDNDDGLGTGGEEGDVAESEQCSGEEETPVKPPMDYQEWKKQNVKSKIEPKAVDVWEMATKAANERAELTARVKELEQKNLNLEERLIKAEQTHKKEKDDLNRNHGQKLQETAKRYQEEMFQQAKKLRDQHKDDIRSQRYSFISRFNTEDEDEDYYEKPLPLPFRPHAGGDNSKN